MGDPRVLSGGIAEALIATAAGLCVAIPALIAYRYLRGRVERIVVEMEKKAMRMADAVEAAARPRRALGRRLTAVRLAVMNLKPRRHEEPEINVVSLIDVVLLLVVFFMLSSRFTDEGRLRVHLPQASAVPTSSPQSEPLVVTVTQQGSYLVNERELINSSPDTLRAALLKEAGTNRDMRVTIRADGARDAPVGDHGNGRARTARLR